MNKQVAQCVDRTKPYLFSFYTAHKPCGKKINLLGSSALLITRDGKQSMLSTAVQATVAQNL